MGSIDVTTGLIFLVGMIALFLFTVSPAETTRAAAQWNLLAIGGVITVPLIYIISKKKGEIKEYFKIKSGSDAINKIAVGVVFGILTLVIINVVMSGIFAVHNLLGSITFNELGSLTTESAFFIGIIQPIVETILFMSAFVIFSQMLKGKVPFSKAIAGVILVILFGAFHFARIGQGMFEFSFPGFFDFLFNTTGLAAGQSYVGGLPQLIMGAFWTFLAVIYKDIFIPLGAHMSTNIFSLFLSNPFNPFIGMMVLILLLVIGVSFYFSRFKQLEAYDFKAVAT